MHSLVVWPALPLAQNCPRLAVLIRLIAIITLSNFLCSMFSAPLDCPSFCALSLLLLDNNRVPVLIPQDAEHRGVHRLLSQFREAPANLRR